MSEFLGSAFRNFVDNRKAFSTSATPSAEPPQPESRKRPAQPLPLTPLRIPNAAPPPQKRLRYSQLPTVLIPESFVSVPLVSPVSILSTPAFPAPSLPCNSSQSSTSLPANASQVGAQVASMSQQCTAQTRMQPLSYPISAAPSHTHQVPVKLTEQPQPIPPPPTYTDDASLTRRSDVHELINRAPSGPLKRPREPSAQIYRQDYGSPSQSHYDPPVPRMPVKVEVTVAEPQARLQCTHCKAHFEDREALLTHIKQVHQRPFACKVAGCTACFSKQNHLSRHVRIVHNKERPFACTEPGCGSRFGSKSHLGDHTRAVHMRLRDFKCHICDASWSKRFNLEKHIRIRHLGEKPFKCKTCNLSFGTRSHVTRHELKVHKKTEGVVSRR